MNQRRAMMLAYRLARKRAESKAARERDALSDRFVMLSEAMLSEVHKLRSNLVDMHLVEDAMIEKAEHGPVWLH